MLTMSSVLDKRAANVHEAAAKRRCDAVELHDMNKLSDAKDCSKSAMESSTTAHDRSAKACQHSSKDK